MVLLFFVVLEFSARVDDALHWNAPFWGNYSNERLTVTDALGHHGRPNARFEKWQLNSFGFRGPEIEEKKPPGIIRVLVTGASETFGLYERAGKEYPAELQRQLDWLYPNCFQVINASCAGMSPPRIEQAMRSWFYRFKPDIVLFYPSPQFYLDEVPPNTDIGSPGATPSLLTLRLLGKAKLVIKSFLPEHLQSILRRLMIEQVVRRHEQGWVWTQPPVERAEMFRQHLAHLVVSVKEIGALPVLVTHANRFGTILNERDREQLIALRRFYPRASTEIIIPFESIINETIRKTGNELGRADH